MLSYVARRLLWLALTLVGISIITFLLMHAVPGGPWDQEKQLAPEVVANLNRRYGLDLPLWQQYGRFLWHALQGDLGVSYVYQDRSVADIIRQGLPASASLGALAFVLSIAVGLPLGVGSALRRNTSLDYASVFLATVFAALPNFILGIILLVLFSATLHLLPATGWGTPDHLVMPALALAALPAAYNARITRASVLEVLGQEHVVAAYAKGLAPRVIVVRHVLRNALIPILTVLGPELAFLVSGSFIVETLFSVPGVGRFFVQGVFARDYGLIMGTTLFYAAVIAAANLGVDILYAVVDPRVRYR